MMKEDTNINNIRRAGPTVVCSLVTASRASLTGKIRVVIEFKYNRIIIFYLSYNLGITNTPWLALNERY